MPPDDGAALAAYQAFAWAYDAFTADHDYDTWTATLETLSREHGLTGESLLDVACGTGKSFLPFLRRGYRVSGCDLSPAMLAVARRKAGGGAQLFLADMRSLPELEPSALVTCLDDALNYLLEPADLLAAFTSARCCLRPDGLYLFDLNTLGAYRTIFAADAWSEVDGCLFVWRGRTSRELPSGGVALATIETFAPAGRERWRRCSSDHFQRHHSHDAVLGHLRAAGLRCLAVRGVTPDGVLHEQVDELSHTKRLYLATPARATAIPRRR